MSNILMNAAWQRADGGLPEFFETTGPFSYDERNIDGCRTMTLSMPEGEAEIKYLPKIDVSTAENLTFGLTLRAIKAESVHLCCAFFTGEEELIAFYEQQINGEIEHHFRKITVKYPAPHNAAAAQVSVQFMGETVAVTLYAPEATAS